MPQDAREITALLTERHRCAVFPRWTEDPESPAQRAFDPLEPWWCIARVDDLAELRPRSLGAGDLWVFDVQVDPLIEWSPSLLRDGLLHPGRLYYTERFVHGDRFCDKDPDFVSAARRILAAVRRHTTVLRHDGRMLRVGAAAREAILSGVLQARVNPPGARG
ncbi:hypothetical protein ABZ249_07860 [Nocardiopsis sp. NPDC006139]|uniref:hypothetical protein n=1 Tax=Nocardiopsis sp. NPDC006139 TaxID=3154578 RepID=UPI0033AC943C